MPDLLHNSAAQWIFGIAGAAILISIAYYFIGNLKKEIDETTPTKEDHLVEFDRMVQSGNLHSDEFKEVKKNLGAEIAEKTKMQYKDKI